MTQRSWFWGGISIGDAALPAPYGAPYSDDVFSDVFRSIFTYDRRIEGTLVQYTSTNPLQIYAAGANNISMATGTALVDGKLYGSDAVITLALPDGAYTPVLRKDFAAQTVRAILDRPYAAAVTQVDGAIWEIPLADVLVAGGVVTTIADRRVPVHAAGARALLGEFDLIAPVNFIDFTGIPQGFTRLELEWHARGDIAAMVADYSNLFMSFNAGVPGAAWYYTGFDNWTGNPPAPGADFQTAAGTGTMHLGLLFGESDPAPALSGGRVQIFNYSVVGQEKIVLSESGSAGNVLRSSHYTTGRWVGTAAVTSIRVQCTAGTNLVATSHFRLYGIP